MAAFTGALLVGFEVVLTHWSYLYLPWFFPFVAFAVLAPRTAEALVSDTASFLPAERQSVGSVSPTGSDAVSDT